MLVLRRKSQQSLVIATEIEVKVLEIRGSRVKLGIVAPPGTRVSRREVWVPVGETPIESPLARGTAMVGG